MSDGERFERLKSIMVKTFGVEEARITPSAHLVEDL